MASFHAGFYQQAWLSSPCMEMVILWSLQLYPQEKETSSECSRTIWLSLVTSKVTSFQRQPPVPSPVFPEENFSEDRSEFRRIDSFRELSSIAFLNKIAFAVLGEPVLRTKQVRSGNNNGWTTLLRSLYSAGWQ